MKQNNQETSYWPHMILGFLLIGITLGYWTVKSASSLPVSEENTYMTKYQTYETDFNAIKEAQERFDARYRLTLKDVSYVVVPVKNSKAKKSERAVVLQPGVNRFVYEITDVSGKPVADMNASFLLTRPFTNRDDIARAHVPFKEGAYIVDEINITKPGRYVLEFKATKGDATGYVQIPAYLSSKTHP